MKFAAATTLLFATLALASPAPVAQPEPAAVAQPLIESRNQLHNAIAARDANAEAIEHIQLEARKKGKPKVPKGSSNNSNAADSLSASKYLQYGAVTLGLFEIARQLS